MLARKRVASKNKLVKIFFIFFTLVSSKSYNYLVLFLVDSSNIFIVFKLLSFVCVFISFFKITTII